LRDAVRIQVLPRRDARDRLSASGFGNGCHSMFLPDVASNYTIRAVSLARVEV
jgi:hypothetical protein